jgi:hypothetical protein
VLSAQGLEIGEIEYRGPVGAMRHAIDTAIATPCRTVAGRTGNRGDLNDRLLGCPSVNRLAGFVVSGLGKRLVNVPRMRRGSRAQARKGDKHKDREQP